MPNAVQRLRTSAPCSLIGAQLALVGIRAAVAETRVRLNLSLSDAHVYPRFREAVSELAR